MQSLYRGSGEQDKQNKTTKKHMKQQKSRTPRRCLWLLSMLLALGICHMAHAFVHPGVLSKQSDLDRMAAQVANGVQPWQGAWNNLVSNPEAASSWVASPVADIIRGCGGNCGAENYYTCMRDAAAAYQNALEWHITGNTANANCAVNVLNAWSAQNSTINPCCTDHALLAGIQGYQWAAAAELMRTYSGWSSSDQTRFKNWMRNVWYARNNTFLTTHFNSCITHYWCNWDACNMASIAAIGVLLDDSTIFNQAVNYYKTGAGNGALNQAIAFTHGAGLGQWQESGRDQGHNKLGLGLMANFLEVAWNQGVDLYSYVGNGGRVFFDGAEYVARFNLSNSVPYTTYNNCDNVNQTVISTGGQGAGGNYWDLIFNAYRRFGISAPYSQQMADFLRPDWGAGHGSFNASWAYDEMGWTTLTHSLFPSAGTYKLKCRTSGIMLDSWGRTANGSDCAVYLTDSGSANQKWNLTFVGPNVVKLQAVGGGLYLDGIGRTANGSTCGLWAGGSSNNQRWTIIDAGGGYYRLKNVTTGMCLDVGASPYANGDAVEQWPQGGSNNQQWQFVP
jgi:hypothetical protein